MDFSRRNYLVGVVHLPALPGAPRYEPPFPAVVERTCRDAEKLARAGFDAIVLENFNDVPFFRGDVEPATVAAMAVCADAVRCTAGLPIGVNVLRNDGVAAISVAVACQAAFVRINVLVGARVTDQGVVQSDAARVVRLRQTLMAKDVGIVADIDVKHSVALAPSGIDDEAREAVERAGADVLVVTGTRTGVEAERDRVLAVKAASRAPVWLGSGVRADTVRSWLEVADGIIVGSDLRAGGRAGGAIELDRARAFVAAARG